jgi:hypothetical protein
MEEGDSERELVFHVAVEGGAAKGDEPCRRKTPPCSVELKRKRQGATGEDGLSSAPALSTGAFGLAVELSMHDEMSSDWSPDISEDEADDCVFTAGLYIGSPAPLADVSSDGAELRTRGMPADVVSWPRQEDGRSKSWSPIAPVLSMRPPGGRDTPYSPKTARGTGTTGCCSVRMSALPIPFADCVRRPALQQEPRALACP